MCDFLNKNVLLTTHTNVVSGFISSEDEHCDDILVEVQVVNGVGYLDEETQLVCDYECKQGGTCEYESLQWNHIETNLAYRHYWPDPGHTGPQGEYKGRLDGELDEDSTLHTLVLFNTTWDFETNWRCIMRTESCPNTGNSAEKQLKINGIVCIICMSRKSSIMIRICDAT